MGKKILSNLQLELLKLYSTDLNQTDLEEIKQVLAKFFAQRAIAGADKIWEEKGLTNDDRNRSCY